MSELEAAIAFLRANGCSETLSVLEREYQPQPQPQPEQPAVQPSAPPPDHPSQAVPPLEQAEPPPKQATMQPLDYLPETAPPVPAPQRRSLSQSERRANRRSRNMFTTEEAPPEDFEGFELAEDEPVVFFQPEECDDYDARDDSLHSAAPRLGFFDLRVIYDPRRNSLEESVNFPINVSRRARRAAPARLAPEAG